MERVDNIPVNLDIAEIKERLRIRDSEEIDSLLRTAKSLIKAKAVYEVSYVDDRFEDAVIIDGTRFSSRVLCKNLDGVGRVFPYILTIDHGLEQNADASADILEKYYLDEIGNVALGSAREFLEDHLRSKFALDGLSFMSPGSLEDWPIEEQKPLFSVFKGAEESIGVRLTENLLMIPRKSVSGIYFPTELRFYSCQLCPRKGCPQRKAPYKEDLVEQYGISQ